MATVNARNNKLYLDFTYHKIRCREMTELKDLPKNRKRVEAFMSRLEREMKLKTFRYERYFPQSKKVDKFRLLEAQQHSEQFRETVDFRNFALMWMYEKHPEWRETHRQHMREICDLYLFPTFGDKPVGIIRKSDILQFRAELCQLEKKGKRLSSSRINHIMSPLRSVMIEASDRFNFDCPWRNIKPLTVKKSDINPFSLNEVKRIIDFVRADFKCYYTVRFFMGLRTGEIHGLTWDKVDFTRRQIIIDQALGKDKKLGPTKTRSSIRSIDMSPLVYNALQAQHTLLKDQKHKSDFVFCTKNGKPLDYKNITNRIWYPMQDFLGLERRRPYHTRHTTATLWLDAGESPEWIAKQLGHSNTTMLFSVYSRYVPNLTRQDGSAFEKLLDDWD